MSQRVLHISELNVDDKTREKLTQYINDKLSHFSANQERFLNYVMNLDTKNSVVDIAMFMLLSKVCNYFKSSLLQSQNWLFPEACNSVRMALEYGWLAKIIHNENALSFEWMTFHRLDDEFVPDVKKYKKRFGSLDWIRKKSSSSADELLHKETIYKLLSVRSHSNVSSSYFSVRTTEGEEYTGLYGPGGLKSIDHLARCIGSICYCHDYLLSELQVAFNVDFGAKWRYHPGDLLNLSEVIWLNDNGELFVDPNGVNLARQIAFFIALSQSVPKEAFDKVRSKLPTDVADKIVT